MLFKNIKIKWKLLIGFGIVINILLAMSVIGYNRISEINKKYISVLSNAVYQSKSATEAGWGYAKMRRITTSYYLYGKNEVKLSELRKDLILESNKVNDNIHNYLQSVNDDKTLPPDVVKMRKGIAEDAYDIINKKYFEVSERIYKLMTEGKQEEALIVMSEGIALAHEADELINELITEAVYSMNEQSTDADDMADVSKYTLLIISTVAVILSLFFALYISGVITKGITSVSEAAQKISVGDFNVSVGSNYKDEVANLSNTLLLVKETIQKLITDIKKLSQDFTGGDIEAQIDVSAYQGEYSLVVKEINKTFLNMIDDTLEAIHEVKEFGEGNFDIVVKEMPGKKVVMTNSFKTVQSSIKQLSMDISKILKGASDGNLSISLDTSRYKGDWGKLAEGINSFIAAVLEPVREIINVLNQLSGGYLNTTVNGSYKGEFAIMKTALNETMRMLQSYINEISEVLGHMSNQDLTKLIKREYVGDFASLKDSINTIVKTFNKMLEEINAAADQVSAGAKQISQSSVSLAQGTTEQADSVTKLNEKVEEIAGKTIQTAQNAQNANELALIAKESAEIGNDEMKTMLEAMEKINQSSNSISKIIKVIDDIAFQTNLLALNAAVEAARAGQQGKGFAVVAEEVRNLAGKSQDAARETSELIEGSVATVEKGLQIANKTAQTFEKIVKEISGISSIASEVSTASERQSEAISLVTSGTNQITAVIQSNSATSEEQAAASEELSSHAELLKAMVGEFKLSDKKLGF